MSYTLPADDQPVTLTWITASIERHERTVPLGTLRTYLDHARERAGRPHHPDYARDLNLLKDTWLGVHESEILDCQHIRRITGHNIPPLPPMPVYTVTVSGAAGSEHCQDSDAVSTYVVHAAELESAKQLVLAYHAAGHDQDGWGDAITEQACPEPDVTVVEDHRFTFAGTPGWPNDQPGRTWTDLRADPGLLDRAYKTAATS